MDRCQRIILLLMIVVLAACDEVADWGVAAQSAPPARVTSTLQTTSTPACTVMPLPTGEGFYEHVFRVLPPRRVRAGETFSVRFEAGMVVGASEQICGEETQVLQPSIVTAQAMTRQVIVRLDYTELLNITCGFECTLNITIPSSTPPGEYMLTFVTSIITPARFPIRVEPLMLKTFITSSIR
jgi:hypothetical protein